jgi:hypothetical protein
MAKSSVLVYLLGELAYLLSAWHNGNHVCNRKLFGNGRKLGLHRGKLLGNSLHVQVFRLGAGAHKKVALEGKLVFLP